MQKLKILQKNFTQRNSQLICLNRVLKSNFSSGYSMHNLASDAIAIRQNQNKQEILLITRLRDPFKGMFAFPGGFVDQNEDPKDACLRELKEECGIEGFNPQLVTVAGKPGRDPRKHVISIVYYVNVDPQSQVQAGDDAATACWYNLQDVVKNQNQKFQMAFDHRDILDIFIRKFKSEIN
ncbi:nudix hydrolase [Stylonychia lemnae]|uniref:Nudix hydrolase n=1 Tax=Stylonychia lemnae TaxID=5949 RepID=A0A078A9V2_STYLE|nr:nudix hydrolase [Stylonychia lemnae]|eukprot:CDW78352.1 nudix hydrolase [Stylonychia lemnae]